MEKKYSKRPTSKIAIENGVCVDGLPNRNLVIFHSYVSFPEGNGTFMGYGTGSSMDFRSRKKQWDKSWDSHPRQGI